LHYDRQTFDEKYPAKDRYKQFFVNDNCKDGNDSAERYGNGRAKRRSRAPQIKPLSFVRATHTVAPTLSVAVGLVSVATVHAPDEPLVAKG
jgi:hypothetical protein